MLSKLHIDNLKCFKQFSLPLAPLTLLTGFNAAGKSTATQSLLLLAQAARGEEKNWNIPLNGDLVQLGTPGEALHEGADADLLLGVESEHERLSWVLKAENRSQAHAMRVDRILWQAAREHGVYLPNGDSLDGLLPNHALAQLKDLTKLVADTIFLSAVRSGADDVYPIPATPDPIRGDVGVRGEFSAWWLQQMSDETIAPERCHPMEPARMVRLQFNAWAGELFPGAQINATRIPNTQLIQLSWRNHETDSWRRPSNIGYGLTYALPILTAGLIAKSGQILVIDSPEAHLHPMGQSAMGRFLAMIAAAGVQVIVETHSDHVLNGVRLAIYEGKLAAAEAAIHFFNFREIVQQCADRNLRNLTLQWIQSHGPFWDDERETIEDDYFECAGHDVTEQGAGEAARRLTKGLHAVTYSFGGGGFDYTPLAVQHGLAENPLACFDVQNYWDPSQLHGAALVALPNAANWAQVIEQARLRFPRLIFSERLLDALQRETISNYLVERIFELLGTLQEFVESRTPDGGYSGKTYELIANHFSGSKAWFTDESMSNKDHFRSALCFADPVNPGTDVFAPWHGKIKTPQFRIHFPWPLQAHEAQLRIVYIGPKILKT